MTWLSHKHSTRPDDLTQPLGPNKSMNWLSFSTATDLRLRAINVFLGLTKIGRQMNPKQSRLQLEVKRQKYYYHKKYLHLDKVKAIDHRAD